MATITDKRASALADHGNPLFNDRKLKLGTFSSNLSGGCAISKIDGVLKADWPSTLRLAELSEAMDFEALVPVGRWKGFGGETNFNGEGFESFSWASAIAASTQKGGVFATTHVPTIHPIFAAKMGTTIDHVSKGRFVKRLWTEEKEFDHEGKYFKINKGWCRPFPIQKPYPPIMNAGGSETGRHYAAKNCDVAFVTFQTRDPDQMRKQVSAYRELARNEYGRDIKVWANSYIVQGETEKEAWDFYNYYVKEKGDWAAATNLLDTLGLNAQTLPLEAIEPLKEHFIAGWGGVPLIGTRDQIVDGLKALSGIGLDGTLLSWARYIDGMEEFMHKTYPLAVQAGLR